MQDRWELPDTFRSSSRFGDGYDGLSGIRVYQLPPKFEGHAHMPVWQGSIGGAIDIIRYGHRQCVCWPSIHKRRQTQYRWRNESTGELLPEGVVPRCEDIPMLSEEFVEAVLLKPEVKRRKRPSTAVRGSGDARAESRFLTDGQPCRKVQAALDRALASVAGTTRYDDMVKSQVAMVRLGEQGHLGTRNALEQYEARYITVLSHERDASGEWNRAIDGLDGLIEEAGLTPDQDKGCCTAASAATTAGAIADGALKSVPMGARLAEERLKDRFIFVPGLGWHQWDGCRWKETPIEPVTAEAVAWAEQMLRAMVSSDAARRNVTEALRYREIDQVQKLVQAARLHPDVLVEADRLDAHPWLLNTPGCVVDLRDGSIRPNDPALLITRSTRVPYRCGARHEDWDKALQAVPMESREYLQRRLGQACTGFQPADDVVLFLKGGGANGKSTLLSSCVNVLGDYAMIVPDRVLLANADAHTTELMTLRGLRLAVMEELPEGRHLNIERLKKIAGTEWITARRIRQDSVTFPVTHSLMISTNHLPVVSDNGHATWRRLQSIEFPYTYLRPEQAVTGSGGQRQGEAGLRHRVKAGHEQQKAALAWMVAGAIQGIDTEPPTAVATHTKAWRNESDLIGSFLDEWIVGDPGSHISSVDLLFMFNRHLKQRGQSQWSERTFAPAFLDHDQVKQLHVVKKLRRPTQRQSRPNLDPDELPDLSKQYTAFTGIRFAGFRFPD